MRMEAADSMRTPRARNTSLPGLPADRAMEAWYHLPLAIDWAQLMTATDYRKWGASMLKLSAAALAACVVTLSSPAAAQDPCNVREQWIRFVLANEFLAGRLPLDTMISIFQANVSPQCGTYPGPPRPLPPASSIGTKPYGCTAGVCTLPDGTIIR
jgi:hypothetical protein